MIRSTKYNLKFCHLRNLSYKDTLELIDNLEISVSIAIDVDTISLCKVYDMENNLISVGYSVMLKGDQFSKEEARMRSIKRAISDFSKEDRTDIWGAYHGRY